MINQARRGLHALRFAYPNDFRHRACEASAHKGRTLRPHGALMSSGARGRRNAVFPAAAFIEKQCRTSTPRMEHLF
jgi:hypothetical protein